MRILIDRFIAALAALQNPKFIVSKTAGTLGAGDWQDEIHPNKSGIKRLVPKFEIALKRLVN